MLHADDAEIITLFYKNEQTLEEIGEILGLEPNTAKVRLHRARARLKEKMEKWRFIFQSMTRIEKRNPDIMNDSRRKRVARGSGMTEHDVKELIKQYNNSRSMMKQAKGRQMQGMLRRFGIG